MSWFSMAPPVVERPMAAIVQPELAQLEAQEYVRVVEALGLGAPALEKQRLLQALVDLGIPVYPFEAVRAYMNGLYKGTHKKWFWRPLRGSLDNTGVASWGSTPAPEPNGICVLSGHYNGTVPLAVLLTAEKIQKRMPNVGFFVTDAPNKSDVKDPFLAISLAGLAEMIVVEIWDEPGFKR